MKGHEQVPVHMGKLLADSGLRPNGLEILQYGERPAWTVFYKGDDCKLQICWSAREGGVDVMLAPLDAPDEFGLVNESGQWRFMLALSDVNDSLETPSMDASAETWWTWRSALFEAHFDSARAVLLQKH